MKTLDTITGLRSGEIDLLDHMQEVCDRIESLDPKIHALVEGTFDRKRVLKEASLLKERYPDPDSRPPLFGVSMGVKDIFRVWSFPTRCGSNLPPELFHGVEATCVSKLKSAGAIVIGKTVTTEFAYFEPGPTRNPYDPEHTPGGSSSGSAAGVAMDFFLLALGTQTVGSVIRPASFCGVIGFKPSFGRISLAGVIPFSKSADHAGMFCKDLSGIEPFMSILAEDWRSIDEKALNQNPVFAVPEGPYLDQATDHGRRCFEKRVQDLLNAGLEVIRINALANINTINENHNRLIAGEMARVHSFWYRQYEALYRPRTTEIIRKGMTVSEDELKRLSESRIKFRNQLERLMDSEGIDYWICPSATDHPPRGLETTGDPIMNLPWTHAGLPVLSIPSGLDDAGLPQGIQIIGRFGKDEELSHHCLCIFGQEVIQI
ncbi:MAG: amidase [Deltaproteobacteria bacterium]|nr:amidase [Deltaproteobacteria bacterium]